MDIFRLHDRCDSKPQKAFLKSKRMKVKDLIAQLQNLDQEKEIYVLYDGMPQEPEFEVVSEKDARGECEAGDYAHIT